MIPFLDLLGPNSECRAELDEAYRRFMDSGWYVLGDEVRSFESEYASYCEARYCVGVGHGLDAIRLALNVFDVGPGDEVIVPTNTYIATWIAVTQAGATPVPVEPEINSFNMNPEKISNAINKKTKVILPVNLYGHPCDYDPILAIAKNKKLNVIIDNAQAQGARYNGRRVGGIADIECHSFYPSKNLGAYGEAGAVTTNDPDIADRVKVLRNYGSRIRYCNEEIGYNSRLDELQAAFLRVKLRHLDEWNARRAVVARTYSNGLAKIAKVTIPRTSPESEHVWHQFVIRIHERDELQKYLTANDIQTLIHYPTPPHKSEAYSNLGFSSAQFPLAEELASSILSLPISPFTNLSDCELIVDRIKEFFG